MALGIILLSFGYGMFFSALALLLCGACWVTTNALLNVSLQLSTPRWVVGRSLSFYMMSNAGGMALGSWVWGLVAEMYGLQFALLASAVTLLLGVLIGLKLPLPEFERLDLTPLNRFIEPTLAVQLTQRTGPIMVTVDFDIGEPDIPAFLEAMSARRRACGFVMAHVAGHCFATWSILISGQRNTMWRRGLSMFATTNAARCLTQGYPMPYINYIAGLSRPKLGE